MKCPYCDNCETRVVDSRESSDRVRRRRECSECGRRFTTYEKAEKLDIKVRKRNGEVQEFQEEKIRSGIKRAVKKTEMTDDEVDEVVDQVKRNVRGETEITTEEIGDEVLEELKKRNEVAYIRFASVYDSFESAESFQKKVEALQNG